MMAAKLDEAPTDRRVGRTRAALQQALIALILKRGYETITVEDICRQANVGRSTFYWHYADKDDLKRRGLEHLRQQLVASHARARTDDGLFAFCLPMLEHARAHLDLYRALASGRGGEIALGEIRDILTRLVRDDLTRAGKLEGKDNATCELATEFVVGAFMAVLNWWLDRGAKPAPAQVAALFRRLAERGVSPA
jgi:AcrR family transcriptional regulator